MAIEVNWRQVQATHRALGGEGTLILQCLPDGPATLEVLHSAIGDEPFPEGEGPANGSWIKAPKGYLLIVEADPGKLLQQWIEQLADNLTAAGITGTLTGARGVGRVAWAKELESTQTLAGMLAYQPLPSRTMYGPGWGADPATREAVLDHILPWTLADTLLAQVSMGGVSIPTDPAGARTLLNRSIQTDYVGHVTGYARALHRVRFTTFHAPTDISFHQHGYSPDNWTEMVGDLRQQILTAPRDLLTQARVDAYDWTTLLDSVRGKAGHDGHALLLYPDLWGEWTPDPCGIQILTSTHLAKAHDLSDWNTTPLDGDHYLIEAKDLAPWFAQPPHWRDYRDPDLIAKARSDFGDMILTPQRAASLGLTTRPLRH